MRKGNMIGDGIVSVMIGIFAVAATSLTAGGNTARAAARHTVVEQCSNGFTKVLVTNWSGYGLTMYVYENGRLVESGRATRHVIEDSSRRTRIAYSTGTVTAGGANLRVIVRDSVFPQLAGSAHLTMSGSNDLLKCE